MELTLHFDCELFDVSTPSFRCFHPQLWVTASPAGIKAPSSQTTLAAYMRVQR